MDIEKFRHMVNSPNQTKTELMNVWENARRKGASEHLEIVSEVLNRRFPGWGDTQAAKQGGKTPNVARFRGKEASFDTAREGYVWLIERFVGIRPTLFSDPSSETLRLALGRRRNYFAKTPSALFRSSPHLADNEANFTRLSNGWLANVNLNNAQKFDVLMRFAGLTGAQYPDEWDWLVHGATDLLADKQRATITAREIFLEILEQLDNLK